MISELDAGIKELLPTPLTTHSSCCEDGPIDSSLTGLLSYCGSNVEIAERRAELAKWRRGTNC